MRTRSPDPAPASSSGGVSAHGRADARRFALRFGPLALSLLWILGCLLIAGERERAAVERLEASAAAAAHAAAAANAQYLAQYFASYRGAIRAAAYLQNVHDLLIDLDSGALDPDSAAGQSRAIEVATRLAEIVDAVGVGTMFLADRRGLVRANSGRLEANRQLAFDVSFRAYFEEAMAGGYGAQFAISQIDHAPGYFFSAPVWNGGRVIGVLAVRLDLQEYGAVLGSSSGDLLVVDEYDVVVLAPHEPVRPPCAFDGAAPSLSQEDSKQRYGLQSVPPCGITDGSRRGARSGGQPYDGSVDVADTRLRIAYRGDSGKAAGIVVEQRVLWILVAGLGIIAITLTFKTIRYVDDLKERATTDALTSLNNRAHTTRLVASLLSAADRDPHRRIAAVLIDVDKFKAVNDTFGHAAGDAVLKRIAGLLQATGRKGDVLGRWGGEEFAVFGHVENESDAVAFGERLRTAIAEAAFGSDETMPGHVTVSIGVALHGRNESLDSVVSRADAGLYAAKAGGRNQVRLVKPPSSPIRGGAAEAGPAAESPS